MSMSPLENGIFTAERDPAEMFIDLMEYVHQQARIEAGPSWPLGMASTFELQRSTRVELPKDDRRRPAKNKLRTYSFIGSADSNGNTAYNVTSRVSTSLEAEELSPFHVPFVYAALASSSPKVIKKALSDPETSFKPTEEPFEIEQCSVGFMKAMCEHVIRAKQLPFRGWSEHEYGLDESTIEFWYRERQGYEINGSSLVISEYTSDEASITDEFVHGVGLDDNNEELLELRLQELEEGADPEKTPTILDARGILFESAFKELIQAEFQGEEMLTTPFYVHAQRAVKMIDAMRQPNTFNEGE